MRGVLDQDSRKAANVSTTLGRLGGYFARFWPMLLLALLLVVISTWTQVTSPQLTGQAVDCFLVPIGQRRSARSCPGAGRRPRRMNPGAG
jgi:ATP-binding cassette subfamily B protein